MKKLIIFVLAAGTAMAGEWTGYIIDEACSGKKEMLGNVTCAQNCMKRGSPAVLVTEDGLVENRVIEIPLGVPAATLAMATNFLNARLIGRTLEEARQEVFIARLADHHEASSRNGVRQLTHSPDWKLRVLFAGHDQHSSDFPFAP